MAKDINNIIYRVEVDATSGKISIDGITKSFEQADKAFLKLQKDVAKGIPNATKNVKNLGDATGSATSATMELSRVISDAPYGIRGMANNITQLVSQLGTASMKAGGLTSALKLMGKQLLGPLGIVFAITAVVSAMDFFFGANKKAEESMDSFRVTASKAAVDLKSLLVVVKEDMLSKEDLAVVVDKVNKKYKDLNLSIDEEGRLTKESRIQIDKKIKSMGNLALANAMMAEIEKKQSEIAKAAVEMQEDTSKDLEKLGVKDLETFKQRQDETEKAYIKRMNALGEHQKGYYKGEIDVDRVNRIARVRRQVASFEETKKRVQEQTKELLKISTTEGFFDNFFESKDDKGGGPKTKKLSPFKTPEDLELEVKSNMSAIDKLARKTELINLKSEEKSRLATTQSEEDKIFIKEEYALKKLDIDEKYEKKAMEAKKLAEIQSATESNIAYQRKIDKDLAAFEAKLRKEGKALTDAEAKMLQDAKKVASDKKANANQELMDTVVDIEAQYSKLFPFWEQMAAARRAAIGTGKKIDTDNEFTLEDGLNSYMEVQQGLTNFMSGEFQRQITLEQNKTNAINNELRERLNGENLSKSERKRIQLEIARNDEALRKKQEKIEKKRFKMQKAANISAALIQTYLAASTALKNFGGVPTGIPAMSATIAAGLLNVAAIARQKFQSSAGATPTAGALGGGGSGGNDRSFNFNLAGASRENQLANTLQGRFNQPLQAYVVSRDITNQQQLDEEITSSASFG